MILALSAGLIEPWKAGRPPKHLRDQRKAERIARIAYVNSIPINTLRNMAKRSTVVSTVPGSS
jgi:hypothetical protein